MAVEGGLAAEVDRGLGQDPELELDERWSTRINYPRKLLG